MTTPQPLVPADIDLRDFPYMPVDIRRLLTSETWLMASGDEKSAAMTLWLESWHQVPAGSLPDNDKMLAILSQAGGRWKKIGAAALRGWVKCTDGRLYHPVVCEKVLEAWEKKHAQRQRTRAAREARTNKTVTASVTENVTDDATEDVTADATTSVTETVTSSKGKGREREEKKDPSGPKKSSRQTASRLPTGWRPTPEGVAFAANHGLSPPETEREFERFRNHWTAKAGRDAAKLDWDATWRNWVLKAAELLGRKPQANGADPFAGHAAERNAFGDRIDWPKRIAWSKAHGGEWPEMWGDRADVPEEFERLFARETREGA